MTILSEQLKFRARGSLNQTEDWWTLCYDTEAREFYIEHQWDHMDPYNIGKDHGSFGKNRLPVEGYDGPGSEKLEEAKRLLLEKAGA
jgi:hypothetical protein